MLCVGGIDALGLLDVAGAIGAAAHFEMSAAFEEAIDDVLGQIAIMQHVAPGRQRLVGGDEDRELPEVAFVDDPIEHVGRVGRVREVADFIEDQHVRVQKRGERRVERAETGGVRQLADQHIGGDEARVEAMLERAIGQPPEDDRPVATRLARYCARNPVALERLTHDRAAKVVSYRSDKSDGPTAGSETVDPLAFLARVLVHISDKGHVTTRYYGWYANRPRAMRRQAEPAAAETPPLIVPAPRLEPTDSTRRWATLLQQIFEVDPLDPPPAHRAR